MMIMPGDCVHCIMFHAGGSRIRDVCPHFPRVHFIHTRSLCSWLNNFIAFGYGFMLDGLKAE